MPDLGFVSRFIIVDMEIHLVIHLIFIVLSNKKELIYGSFDFIYLFISIIIHIYVFIPIKIKN